MLTAVCPYPMENMPKKANKIDGLSGFRMWLRQARLSRGWTMDQLADSINSSGPVISNLERGTRNPSRDMVKRLAASLYLGLPSSDGYRRFESEGLEAAGFLPDEPSNDLGEYPPSLIAAMALLKDLPTEIQVVICDLWYMQAKPHHEIELRRRQRERMEAELNLKNTAARNEGNVQPIEQLENEHGYDAATAELRTPEGIEVRSKLRADYPDYPDGLIDQMARGYLYAVKEAREEELVNKR